jgi:restriction system protein
LLEKMRYGNPEVIGRSGDGGIDGTCSLDALGLVRLHFQAKRWKKQVRASEIRDFIGGIQTSRGEYGIFVTTSDFTRDAIETAKKSGKEKQVILATQDEEITTLVQAATPKTQLKSIRIQSWTPTGGPKLGS